MRRNTLRFTLVQTKGDDIKKLLLFVVIFWYYENGKKRVIRDYVEFRESIIFLLLYADVNQFRCVGKKIGHFRIKGINREKRLQWEY